MTIKQKTSTRNTASRKAVTGKISAGKATKRETAATKKVSTIKKPATRKTASKKPATQKTAAKKPVAKKTTAKTVEKTTVRRSALGFRVNEHIVYPAHGVGQIQEIVTKEVAGTTLDLFVIYFEKEKMTLSVPLPKTKEIGMRKLAGKEMLDGAIKTLKGRARIKRTMWSRRAQEYEAKINSGDMVAISEVVRDLYRNESQPEQSYSERQLYEAALERMIREYSVIKKITDDEAVIEIENILAQTTSAKRQTDTESDNLESQKVA